MNNMTPFGRFIKTAKMASFWKDGDTFSYHWNYWNPLTLFMLPFLVALIILLGGIKELADNHYMYGFGYSRYWKSRLKQRQFV